MTKACDLLIAGLDLFKTICKMPLYVKKVSLLAK